MKAVCCRTCITRSSAASLKSILRHGAASVLLAFARLVRGRAFLRDCQVRRCSLETQSQVPFSATIFFCRNLQLESFHNIPRPGYESEAVLCFEGSLPGGSKGATACCLAVKQMGLLSLALWKRMPAPTWAHGLVTSCEPNARKLGRSDYQGDPGFNNSLFNCLGN